MIRIAPSRMTPPHCAIVCLCVVFLLPCAAQAACVEWDIGGDWVAVQSNNTSPHFTLQQAGTQIQGSGHWATITTYNTFPFKGDDYTEADASVDGTINGDVVEFTAYWSNGAIGVYSGKIGPQGRIQGITYDRSHPEGKASWYSGRTLSCLSSQAEPPPNSTPPIALGRIHAPGRAVAADRINGTVAAGLVLGTSKTPVGNTQSVRNVRSGRYARLALPRTTLPASSMTPPKGSPPVQAPHDILVGRLRYSQGGETVDHLRLGEPATIECWYWVNASPNPFLHIQPWQGAIDIGGDASQTLEFQGETQAGQHVASVTWTPRAEGTVPIGCVLNPEFADAEANAGNNRWDQSVLVTP